MNQLCCRLAVWLNVAAWPTFRSSLERRLKNERKRENKNNEIAWFSFFSLRTFENGDEPCSHEFRPSAFLNSPISYRLVWEGGGRRTNRFKIYSFNRHLLDWLIDFKQFDSASIIDRITIRRHRIEKCQWLISDVYSFKAFKNIWNLNRRRQQQQQHHRIITAIYLAQTPKQDEKQVVV